VLITGESGLGKSELGLELISRGNGLVADDAVDLYRINQTTIEGVARSCCRTCWKCAASVRSISAGYLVKRQCAAKCGLKLIVHLVRRETLERDYERIPY